ncbi:MAG: S-layer homology domain-containing protein [Clostridia bacterium]|nr:S-layer homology domain-containing protein [Clostridia bacterium]
MKKLISILLALIISASMMLSAALPVSAAETTVFTDVKSGDWYYTDVSYVTEKGIMQGTSGTHFSPKGSLSRAMAVTVLYRMVGTPSTSGIRLPFEDVKGGKWYTDAVKWAYKNGIAIGKTETRFAPSDSITRAEFATMLHRYVDSNNLELPKFRTLFIKDVSDIPEYAFEAVRDLYKAQVIDGRDDHTFAPYDTITRAEAAKMLHMFCYVSELSLPKDEEKPPINSEVIETTGQLVIKEKKYDYDGGNVTILNIENQTAKDLTLTITAKYLDSDGDVLESETRVIKGFPANFRNYVVFYPDMKYDKLTYNVELAEYKDEAYMKYIAYGSNVQVISEAHYVDILYGNETVNTTVVTNYKMANTHKSEDLLVCADWVVFDKNGEIFWIENYHGWHSFFANTTQKKSRIWLRSVPWDDYKTPDSIKGECTGIIAFRDVTTELMFLK